MTGCRAEFIRPLVEEAARANEFAPTGEGRIVTEMVVNHFRKTQ